MCIQNKMAACSSQALLVAVILIILLILQVSSKLRILTSTLSDLGTYYCKVHSPGSEAMSNAVGVHVSPTASTSDHDVVLYQPLPSDELAGPVIVTRVE